ncbi:MAG: hypothetical protein AB1758_31345 [Candidatus Eremiobacterota bacterium]
MRSIRRKGWAFSLLEVLAAIGVVAVGMLALISVLCVGLKSDNKSLTTMTAVRLADRQLERSLARALTDSPGSRKDAFWSDEFSYPARPLDTGQERVGSDTFHFAVYAESVPGLGGATPENRVKKVDVYVWWWGEGTRQGYGRLQTHTCRLVNEGETD